jgi:copper chaperone CopZ
MKDIRLSIAGMHCDGCASRIQGLLEKAPGVRGVAVSYAEKEAKIRFNPHATDQERVAEVVRTAGFDVTAME